MKATLKGAQLRSPFCGFGEAEVLFDVRDDCHSALFVRDELILHNQSNH